MPNNITILRDRIIEDCLPQVTVKGWTWATIEESSVACGIQAGMTRSVFPNGIIDAVAHFSDYIDRAMLKSLENVPYTALRTKDRVRAAVLARLNMAENHKEAIRHAMAFWTFPAHVIQGQRVLWRSADRIWTWAGDTATDYTRQTKRASLASIMVGTTMVWLNDESPQHMVTAAFLDRRLENVMEIGKAIGTMKKVVPNIFRQANRTQ